MKTVQISDRHHAKLVEIAQMQNAVRARINAGDPTAMLSPLTLKRCLEFAIFKEHMVLLAAKNNAAREATE